jgi:hypothetical protein
MSPALKQILAEIEQLPPTEVNELREILINGSNKPVKRPLDRRLEPISTPDYTDAMRWLADKNNQRQFANKWVALDGDRVIASGDDAREVYAAADASGVNLPLVTIVEDPDAPPFAGI